jgi:hypothetical protein
MEQRKEVICQSCGMPMTKAEDHGDNDTNNKYCKKCAPDGKLMSRKEIREGWISYAMKTENLPREQVEKKVDEEMAKMPAWKK